MLLDVNLADKRNDCKNLRNPGLFFFFITARFMSSLARVSFFSPFIAL